MKTLRNNLFIINPELAKEWHPTKNNGLTPRDVSHGSNKKVHWRCLKRKHEWMATINNRNNGRGCPYCANQLICEDNCLATLNPKLAKEWHPTKNGNLTPHNVGVGSTKKVLWLCPSCDSSWEASVVKRNKGTGCPYCSGKRVNASNCLSTLNPKLAREWDYSINKKLSPSMVTPGSNRKVGWKCKNEHSWMATISDRNGSPKTPGTGCPYCSNKKIDKNNSLVAINPFLFKDWDYEKNKHINPNNIGANSCIKVSWKCHVCGNEWIASVMHRNMGFYKCKRCNSLAEKYSELIKEWDFDKNNLDPYLVPPSSNAEVLWKCSLDHEWKTRISSRTNGKTNCPYCNRVKLKDGTICDSYVEAFFYLKYKNQNIYFKHNKQYDKRFGKYRYDFYFPKTNMYVEVTSIAPSWIKLVGMKRWRKYLKTIDKKKKFVEDKLGGKFEFIQITLNNSQTKFVRQNTL